jgi:two-component system chemotaxis sensor kinase CheA
MFFSDEQIQEAMSQYKDESIELLDAMEIALLEIQENGITQERINAVFRAAHTIKGSSGMLKLDHLVEFTHIAENLLDDIRNDKILFTSEMIGTFLRSKDHMSNLIIAYTSNVGQEPNDSLKSISHTIMEELANYTGLSTQTSIMTEQKKEVNSSVSSGWDIRVQFGAEVFRAGMEPVHFIRFLSTLGEVIFFESDFVSIPSFHAIDPTQCYLNCFIKLHSAASEKEITEVFEFIEDDIDLEITSWGKVNEEYEINMELEDEGIEENPPKVTASVIQNSSSSSEEPTLLMVSHTLRVDSEKIDILINLIGEMVIANANVVQKSTEANNDDLIESVSIVSHMLEEIRESAMKIRMVQIGETFNKFKRIVHDVSQKLGKEVELTITGGDTEMDKTIVEKISDPLVHIVRNAMDHGLENTEERLMAGKKAKGRLSLNAFHDAGTIAIEISDDGHGLDEEKLFAKAVEKGIIDSHAKLTQKEIFNLIFEPGFSTATEVTDLSGRGVGMDVVKRNIQSLRGTVDIKSTVGKGSTFTIRLPLTLAIIDGFLVRVGNTHYVIPLESVLECVELPQNNSEAMSGNQYINLRGTILPILSLRDFFTEQEPKHEDARENVVVVKSGENKFGLIVEELLGEFQTVIKPLGKIYRGVRGIGGSTILGSGEVALIVDVPILINTIGTLSHSSEKGAS